VAWPAVQYFSTFSHKRLDLGRGGRGTLLNIKLFFDFLYNFCLKHFSCGRKCTFVFVQLPRHSCEILTKLEICLQSFDKTLKYQISWKSVQWEPSCSVRTDRRTDMAQIIGTFRNFANAPKKSAKQIRQAQADINCRCLVTGEGQTADSKKPRAHSTFCCKKSHAEFR
jgi:hypothetical protein